MPTSRTSRRARRAALLPALIAGLAAAGAPAHAAPGDPLVTSLSGAGGRPVVQRIALASGGAVQNLTSATSPQLSDVRALVPFDTAHVRTVGPAQVGSVNVLMGGLTGLLGGSFGAVTDAAVDAQSFLAATDRGIAGAPDGVVRRIDPATGATSVAASGGLLRDPNGVATAEEGWLAVTDGVGVSPGRLLLVQNGIVFATPHDDFGIPTALDFLPDGDLVVADADWRGQGPALVRVDPLGPREQAFPLAGLSPSLAQVTDLAVDPFGRVLVTDQASGRVSRIDLATGVATLLATVRQVQQVAVEPGVAPTTTLLDGPNGVTANDQPRFAFEPSQYRAHSTCTFDGISRPCTRTFVPSEAIGAVSPGPHTFSVFSSRFGAVGPAVTRTFVVDPTAPVTHITVGPDGPTKDATPAFSFKGAPEAAFACSLDGQPTQPCTSPFTVAAPLADGEHQFVVVEGGGGSLAHRVFVVDTVAPQTFVVSGLHEGAVTSETQPFFAFGSNEEGAAFRCALDDAPATACFGTFAPARPLAAGRHAVTFTATDAAGNADPTPVVRHFTVTP